MEWKDLKEIVGNTAPILGGLLGGPVGAGVGGLISTALGVNSDPMSVMTELTSNPDAVLKLKQIQLDHKLELEKLKLSELDFRLKDVANARQRQTDSEKATGKPDYNLNVLTWVIVIGFFLIVYFIMTTVIPQGKSDVLYMLLGTLATAFMQVIHYKYGSSAGSKQKTEQLERGK